MNLLTAFLTYARTTPERPLLRSAGQDISYRDMDRRSRQAADVLQQLGVGVGDRVALMCFNTPAFVDCLLGAWRLGAVVVPVNHKLKAPEVSYVLAHSRAKLVIFDAALAGVMSEVPGSLVRLCTEGTVDGIASFDILRDAAAGIAGLTPTPDMLAEILYTSGTTGKPKGCMHTHETVTLSAMNAALVASINRDDRLLMAMPIWHSSPLNNWFGAALYVGATTILLREYQPRAFIQTVQDERATVYFGAPVSYFAPLQLMPDFADHDLSSMRAWIYGGGPIGTDMARKLAQAYGQGRFYQVFGMTEAGPLGTALFPEEQLAKAGSIGRAPTPGIELRVVRDDGQEAGAGERGEIWLRGSTLMKGYLDDEEATRTAFTEDGWYRSGDLARVDEDGYLFIVDRLKDMIITGGENVYSKEVEDALSAHPDVADVAVVGRPHPQWGETVVAHVVPRPGSSLSPGELEQFLESRLARYKIPREFRMVQALPRTPTGKLQKFMLREGG